MRTILDKKMSQKYSLNPGDHIKVRRNIYSHHGIYIGNDEIVHYGGELKNRDCAQVCKVSLDVFLQGGTPDIVKHRNVQFTPEEIVERALSRMGEAKYDLVFENCEHFATWCTVGKKKSRQVIRAVAGIFASTGVVLLIAGKTALKLASRGRA